MGDAAICIMIKALMGLQRCAHAQQAGKHRMDGTRRAEGSIRPSRCLQSMDGLRSGGAVSGPERQADAAANRPGQQRPALRTAANRAALIAT
jgi:hypothetical protein